MSGAGNLQPRGAWCHLWIGPASPSGGAMTNWKGPQDLEVRHRPPEDLHHCRFSRLRRILRLRVCDRGGCAIRLRLRLRCIFPGREAPVSVAAPLHLTHASHSFCSHRLQFHQLCHHSLISLAFDSPSVTVSVWNPTRLIVLVHRPQPQPQPLPHTLSYQSASKLISYPSHQASKDNVQEEPVTLVAR